MFPLSVLAPPDFALHQRETIETDVSGGAKLPNPWLRPERSTVASCAVYAPRIVAITSPVKCVFSCRTVGQWIDAAASAPFMAAGHEGVRACGFGFSIFRQLEKES